jgi:hypothetical protein
MTVDCELFHKPTLDPAGLKRVAIAFQAFHRANPDSVAWFDYLAIEDLRKGEQPKPLLLRITEHSRRGATQSMSRPETILLDVNAAGLPEATPETVIQWREALGSHVADRSLPFIVGRDVDQVRLVAALRQHIPVELVDDILIGGRSWAAFD